jgi:hypothetical protein
MIRTTEQTDGKQSKEGAENHGKTSKNARVDLGVARVEPSI